MSPLLLVHIGAGGLAILAGAAAVSVRKGRPLHRTFGAVFVLAMLTMSVLGAYLAIFGPEPGVGAAPPKASVAVGLLTFYLVTTAWMTARRSIAHVGSSDYIMLLFVLGVLTTLLVFGVQARMRVPDKPGGYIPYFVFAAFAALLSALDAKVILRGGVVGARRLARHLWRMCFALFFAAAFFFIGQQKVMPPFMRGSALLFVPSFAPLILMVVWMLIIRWPKGALK